MCGGCQQDDSANTRSKKSCILGQTPYMRLSGGARQVTEGIPLNRAVMGISYYTSEFAIFFFTICYRLSIKIIIKKETKMKLMIFFLSFSCTTVDFSGRGTNCCPSFPSVSHDPRVCRSETSKLPRRPARSSFLHTPSVIKASEQRVDTPWVHNSRGGRTDNGECPQKEYWYKGDAGNSELENAFF